MESLTFVSEFRRFSVLIVVLLAVLFSCGGRRQDAATVDGNARDSGNRSSSAPLASGNSSDDETLTGQAALGDYSTDAPGVRRRITTADLPKPFDTRSVDNGPGVISRPENAWPKVPAGFKVEQFMTGLTNPRLIRTAPNGDVFVAESYANRVRVLRPGKDAGKVEASEVFLS